jgi:hypothetical protein
MSLEQYKDKTRQELLLIMDIQAEEYQRLLDESSKRIAEIENQWVSVEDRLPDTFQKVLALTTDYDLDPSHTLVIFNGIKTGFLGVGGRKDKDVTHWMPLPDPPKEQGE